MIFFKNFIRSYGLLLLLATASFGLMYDVQLSGDEIIYNGMANSINGALRGSAGIDVVRNGWFSPGMSILVSPLNVLFNSDPPVWVVRFYICSLNFILLIGICTNISNSVGFKCSIFFQSLLLLSPYYLMFLSAMWSDLLSLHFVLFGLTYVFSIFTQKFSFKMLILTSLFCAIGFYLRGLYLPLFFIVAVGFAIVQEKKTGFNFKLILSSSRYLIFLSVFVGVLVSPWTLRLSSEFGFTPTVTSGNMSRIVWFADSDLKKEARELTGLNNNFDAIHRLIASEANTEGVSYQNLGKRKVHDILKSSAPEGLRSKVSNNISSFFALKHNDVFMNRFLDSKCSGAATCWVDTYQKGFTGLQNFSWHFFFATGFILFLWPFRSSDFKGYVGGFLCKSLLALIVLHPLVVLAHERYYVQTIPVIALMIAIFMSSWRSDISMASFVRKPSAPIPTNNSLILTLGIIACWVYVAGYLMIYVTGNNFLIF